MNKKNETRVVCPKCGCEISIPENEHFAAGMCIGKDSGLGTVVLPAANENESNHMSNNTKSNKMKTVEEKINALKEAGVNVGNFFSVTMNGEEKIGKMEGGKISVLADDDPIFEMINGYGDIPERRLFRRWIAAQYMHMELDVTSGGSWYYRSNNFVERLQHNGYMYSWKVLENELRVQVKLYDRDMENFIKYNRGFNKDVAYEMMRDYIEKLNEHINGLVVRHCKGEPYRTIGGQWVYVKDTTVKVFNPLARIINRLKKANTPAEVYAAVHDFCQKMVKLPWETKHSDAFINAFKFNGAFFTMENCILFSHCFLPDNRGNKMSKDDSLKYLYAKAEEYKREGWRLFGLMRQVFVPFNHIDFEAKIAEWRKAKENR